MAEPPRVFISYSHDSQDHRKWVAKLGTELLDNGIEVTLDQWDLRLGGDITLFMERGLCSSDRVLLVCTEKYVRKADAGEGGVGYERNIVTPELAKSIDTDRFVPIVRQADGGDQMPVFLGIRRYIDFSDDDNFDAHVNELVSEIHRMSKKPPLGDPPVVEIQPAAKELVEVPTGTVEPIEAYRIGIDLARQEDLIGWRQFVKKLKPSVVDYLFAWREKYEPGVPGEWDALHSAVDEAVAGAAPLFALALAGIESQDPKFADQRALFDDLLTIAGWKRSGSKALINLPRALAFVYQNLHGAMCLNTHQLSRALELANMSVRNDRSECFDKVWLTHDLIGWPDTLGPGCSDAWAYISTAPERWPWLAEVFGGDSTYKTSLIAYQTALHVWELADMIANDKTTYLESSSVLDFDVPLCFMTEERSLEDGALTLLARQPGVAAELWESQGVTREQMETLWDAWLKHAQGWLWSVYKNPMSRHELPIRSLFAAVL